jgi:hypothetical protein
MKTYKKFENIDRKTDWVSNKSRKFYAFFFINSFKDKQNSKFY